MVIGPLLIVGLASMVSVETTGKGLADHTLSAVKDRDCKIVRGIKGEDICQPQAPETARATVTVSEPTAPQTIKSSSSVQSMEDVFNQRRARAAK
jgi:hypothetical protein